MKLTTKFAAALLLAPVTAFPSSHLWDIQEVYSNRDGSVQFIEFYTTGTDEFFLEVDILQFELDGIPVNTFDFPNDLAGDTTADRTFLVATANFASLYGITPDYMIPANFLSAGISGSLNFGPGIDLLSLAGLPTDGIASLNGVPFDDSPTTFEINAQATPRNFAGQEITIPEPSCGLLTSFGTAGALVMNRRRNVRRPSG